MSIRIKQSKLLVVEGKDEENFFSAALGGHLGIDDLQVLGIGGKANLTRNLKALKNDPDFITVQAIAIVRDADLSDPDAPDTAALRAFESVCGSLSVVGLPCPDAHGTIADGPPRVGIFVMPDGSSDGMLESLCIQSVQDEPEFHCLDEYMSCLSNHAVIPHNLHKARAHAWLASRHEPDKRVGEAARAGDWPWAADSFRVLWDFRRTL